jgi:hypothetical protein
VLRFFSKRLHKYFGAKICENVNNTGFSRHCLLQYVLEPFLIESVSSSHQNQWQARELARIVGEFGYNIDVVGLSTQHIKLPRSYDLIIDVHPGLNDCYVQNLNEGCKKIAYITGSNPDFSNRAEAKRLEELSARRGSQLKQRRYAPVFDRKQMAGFDAMFFLGNDYNLATYSDFNFKSVFKLQNTGVCNFDPAKYSGKTSRSFLFLASGGQVHKGLDLLLEVFSAHPELQLYVCSSFKAEWDFCRLYRKELFHTGNIHPVGFMSIESPQFQRICQECGYVILPSCSEANAGSVLTGMAAGLVPMVSREAGFSARDVHYFPDCSLTSIAETVCEFARKSPVWLEQESQRVLQVVKEQYSHKNYSESVKSALESILL